MESFSLLCEAENSGNFGLMLKEERNHCKDDSSSGNENLIDEKVNDGVYLIETSEVYISVMTAPFRCSRCWTVG